RPTGFSEYLIFPGDKFCGLHSLPGALAVGQFLRGQMARRGWPFSDQRSSLRHLMIGKRVSARPAYQDFAWPPRNWSQLVSIIEDRVTEFSARPTFMGVACGEDQTAYCRALSGAETLS